MSRIACSTPVQDMMSRAHGVSCAAKRLRVKGKKSLTAPSRFFIQTALIALGCVSSAWATDTTERPNFLFILTDDQRYDAMGFMQPFLKTPNIDRIRNEGAWMKNAFCTTALCSPSRASFLTGCTPSRHGVMANETWDYDFDKTPSYHQLLQEAGYQSAYIGKWHMGHSDMPRPGFDYWLSFKGQGKYIDPDFNENGRRFKKEGYMTDILTDYALNWLDKNGDEPFVMYLSHKAVHQRFTPHDRHKGLYKDKMLEMPENYNDPLSEKPYWQRCLVQQWVKDGYRSSDYRKINNARHIPKAKPARKYHHKMDRYYETLMAVDDGIGHIMDKLKAMGQLDNTVIVFAGDNGFLFGEHHMGDKRVAYEESIRIPMVMRYPKLIKPGTTIEEMVMNMDLCPTFLDLAKVEIPEHVQGRSMVPLFGSEPAEWRDQFMYCNWVDVQFPHYPRLVSLRTDEWKLVTYPDIDDMDELYNLKNDSAEMVNLINSPEHAAKIKKLKAQMQDMMKNEEDYKASYARLDKNKPQGLIAHYTAKTLKGKTLGDLSEHKNDIKSRGNAVEVSNNTLMLTPEASFAIEGNESLDISHCPMTLSVWFKAEKNGVIASQGKKGDGSWAVFVDKGIPTFATCDISRFAAAEGTEKCLGKWTHLVATIRGHMLDLYINGEKVASVPRGCYLNLRGKKQLVIGRANHKKVSIAPKKCFTGQLAELKIYRQYIDPATTEFPKPAGVK